jgi:hypothetical protein
VVVVGGSEVVVVTGSVEVVLVVTMIVVVISAHGVSHAGCPHPPQPGVESHKSPAPSPSASNWLGLQTVGQLSLLSGTPSLSLSAGCTVVVVVAGTVVVLVVALAVVVVEGDPVYEEILTVISVIAV